MKFKRKVSIFGKEVSVFALVMIGMVALGSAALIPYFAQITGLVTVNQGLTWNGVEWDGSQKFDFDLSNTTSLEEKTFTSSDFLKNDATIDAEFELETNCTSAEGGCENIDKWYEYKLETNTTQGSGNEDRVAISANKIGITTLNQLQNITWETDIS
ncbi:MAG: hypothetical protein Q8N88_06925, partial [Nanoarchaeota archaeon]|nr:hypothetical protein [Nanoarchaeota archaeon]